MKYECIFVGKVPPPKIDERDIQISDAQCFLENDIKKWKCNLCPKIYSTKQNLRIHVLDHSTDRPKPHSCEECGKAFKQHAHLSTHMLCHRKIKPHTCKVCAKSFTQVGKINGYSTLYRSTILQNVYMYIIFSDSIISVLRCGTQ